eukprot:CAMPEP_0175338962 /NCGR_PEP_ID=MMETSP0095-20121207/5097_1 /TAXON_ID=311494 /ORGANISM="Alexandrium monilatum, Strain CCMP3105" /LENGTH=343 /DNA_ID=CAMNT_0016636365 /DNA_START=15 /DNA_END=1046 /DNA_ORIENTATION=+
MKKTRSLRKLSHVDEEATQQMLQGLLLNKSMGEDAPAELAGGSGRATPLPESPVRGMRSPVSAPPLEAPSAGTAILNIEAEKEKFMSEICAGSTRREVEEWIGKIFDLHCEGRLVAARREAQERRRRRGRGSCSTYSESSVSGMTGYTCYTGTTATALHTVGGSIAAASRPPKSLDSAESLVVQCGPEEPLSVKERVQAFLSGSFPELEEHVNAHLARQTEALQRRVDEDLATKFLRQTQQRKVFDGRANYLRWQSARHQLLQKQLDKSMQGWILEAIESWDQKKAMEGKADKDISDTDLIFDFLTKRAAHIDSGKLPSEIPMFRTLHSSYSLPSMWKDKYNC